MAVPPAEIAATGRQGEPNTLDAVPKIWGLWETEWLPEVKSLLDWWDGFDLQGASLSSLRDHLVESFENSARCWHIHFLLSPLIIVPGSQFRDLYTDLFGEDRGLESHGLTLADDNKSLETDRELWKLSQLLREADHADELVESGSDDELRSALGNRFSEFLETYRNRSGDGTGLAGMCWTEDSGPAIATIRAYAIANSGDPKDEHADRIAERDRLTAEARDNLSGYPQSVRDNFDSALERARQGSRLQEDHAYWIDQQTNARTHYVTMEAGRRLAAAGTIKAHTDVNHLSVDEIVEALDLLDSGNPKDLLSLVKARADDMAYWAKIDAPTEIGTRPSGGPPETASSRGFSRFMGLPVEQDDDPSTVKGTPASPGEVEGVARIIITLADIGKLSPGDIMIAPTTSPPWTPLFRIASAVVTDAGGVLSHCAIVAREYGIPAIVGTGVGTTRIKDGQRVRVDGDAGVITII
jgi:pyruvate,water dikinase